MITWNSNQYLQFANVRTQPSIDLAQRINLNNPLKIIDLGCGPGNSTEVLRQRWSNAMITGLDSSIQMIEAAKQAYPDGGIWQVGDAGSWQADEQVDLVFSNAMLQWLPDHAKVCQNWIKQVKQNGAMAIQIPAHYDLPVRQEILIISRNPLWNERMEVARQALTLHTPGFYYDTLSPFVSKIDMWETTYYQEVDGPEKILEFIKGTELRAYLEVLSSDEERVHFEQLLLERYYLAYPRSANGKVLFPFKRLFILAYK